MQNETKTKYKLGDLLLYFEEGKTWPTKSGIYVGSNHTYYEVNPAKYGFDAIVEIVEIIDDSSGEDEVVRKIMPTRIEDFESGGVVAAEFPLIDKYRLDFAEFAGAHVEDRNFANFPKEDFARKLFERYCVLRKLERR